MSNNTCDYSCNSLDNCPVGVNPDFIIKRFDTNPPFRVKVDDCDGPMDLSDPDLVVEVNMWTKSKLKKNISSIDTIIQLADNVAFDQILIGDTIYIDHPRSPEYMQISHIDEVDKIITVSRGVNSTNAMSWKKGTSIYIYRIISNIGSIEMLTQDILSITGSVEKDQLIESNLVYNWANNDTLTSGCYWLEFKLMKIIPKINTMFANFNSVMQYNVGNEPTLLSPELILINNDFDYKSCVFYLESKSAPYDYFIIKEDENLTIELDDNDAGLITVTPIVYENDTISTIVLQDEGISTISVDIPENIGISNIISMQAGMQFKTLGNIKYKNITVGEYVSGDSNNSLIINFNDNATQESVEYVLNRLSIVNLSVAPQLWTRTIKYKIKSNDELFSDFAEFFVGFNSIPSIQKLEGIEWVRRFPSCGEGFLVKIVHSITKEM